MSTITFRNLNTILISTVIFMRAIIALPLAFAAKKHFAFFDVESTYLTYLVSYVSIFAVELIMTLLSFLTAKFRLAGLNIGYYTALFFVFFFFILNAVLIWNIQHVYENVPWISEAILQAINLASVVFAEAIGFMKTEKPRNILQYQEIENDIPAIVFDIKDNEEIPLADKVKKLWETNYFKTQTELAKFLVIQQSTVSTYLKK